MSYNIEESPFNEEELVVLLAELDGAVCELNHGSWSCPDPKAVDYLNIPMGYLESKDIEVHKRTLSIPICKDCQETLANDDGTWLLFVCTECSGSSWKIRALMHEEYPPGVLQPMKYCPNCCEEFKKKD